MRKKTFGTLLFMMFCALLLIGSSFNREILYEDETHKLYKYRKLYWLEIGDVKTAKDPSIMYTPIDSDYKIWRRVYKSKKGIFDSDVFYSDLPPPVGLLLSADMIYISKFIYYPNSHVTIILFKNRFCATQFLRVLLDKVKNV